MQKLRDNALKVAVMTFLGGFFIGYTLRLFDFIMFPVFYEKLFPVHQEVIAAVERLGGSYPNKPPEFFGIFGPQKQQFEMELMDVFKSNILPPILLVGASVFFALPTMIILFISGIAAGSSFAEIIEFTPILINIKFFLVSLVYLGALLFAASVGFYICSFLYDVTTSREFKVEKTFYDYILYTAGLIVLSISLQYLLLVR